MRARGLLRPRRRWRRARARARDRLAATDVVCWTQPSVAAVPARGDRGLGLGPPRSRGQGRELARVADFEGRFELVIARSFGPPAPTAECAARLLAPRGALVVSEPPDGARPRSVAPGRARQAGPWSRGARRRLGPLRRHPAGLPVPLEVSTSRRRAGKATAVLSRRRFHVEPGCAAITFHRRSLFQGLLALGRARTWVPAIGGGIRAGGRGTRAAPNP